MHSETYPTHIIYMYKTSVYNLRGYNPRCLFIVRFVASVGREPLFSRVVYIVVQKNVARNAFRAATAISQ